MSWATRASDWARRNPRTSAGVAAAIMGGSGDLVAQKIETWLEQQLGDRRTERTIRFAFCFALNPVQRLH